jgi:hypothetical protein
VKTSIVKRIAGSGLLLIALGMGIVGGTVLSGPQGGSGVGASVAYADGCDGVNPPPDLCPNLPTPTPTATPTDH